jgi:hypothetical protein
MPLERKANLALEVLLNEILLVLANAGLDTTCLLATLQKSVQRLQTCKVLRVDRRSFVVRGWYEQAVDMSEVVAEWHRNAQYTGADGEPMPLKREALERLVSTRCGSERFSETLASLRRNRIVCVNKKNLYELRSRRAVLFDGPQLALVRAAVVVPEVLAVALQNGYAVSPEQRDIHRTVRVRHLPRKFLPLWRQLVKERSQDFLEGLDNWLEDHNELHAAEPTVTVAAHICAYTGARPRPAARGRGLQKLGQIKRVRSRSGLTGRSDAGRVVG